MKIQFSNSDIILNNRFFFQDISSQVDLTKNINESNFVVNRILHNLCLLIRGVMHREAAISRYRQLVISSP